MAESAAVIERAVAAGYPIDSVLTEARWLPQLSSALAACPAATVFVADGAVIRATTGFRMHRGPMAAMRRQPLPEPRDVLASARSVVVLDGLTDHTNVGAAFRSAAAFGVDAVLVTAQCADPLYRRSVRVSMGAVFAVPWTRIGDPTELPGFTSLALTPGRQAQPLSAALHELGASSRIALVVGAEGPGLSTQVLGGCDRRVRIPMAPGVDSLNVAAAVAVACYALAAARGEG